jgi:hypothetical protein
VLDGLVTPLWLVIIFVDCFESHSLMDIARISDKKFHFTALWIRNWEMLNFGQNVVYESQSDIDTYHFLVRFRTNDSFSNIFSSPALHNLSNILTVTLLSHQKLRENYMTHLESVVIMRTTYLIGKILSRLTPNICRLLYPWGLKITSAAARLLGSWVRIPLSAWMFVSCVCFCCVGSSVCDRLVTCSAKVYSVCVRACVCNCVWQRNLKSEAAWL